MTELQKRWRAEAMQYNNTLENPKSKLKSMKHEQYSEKTLAVEMPIDKNSTPQTRVN